MRVFLSQAPLSWGSLDLPLLALTSDPAGLPLDPPLGWSLAMDHSSLWFIATRAAPGTSLPGALPGRFTPGLWEADVAELFLADPATGRYLEFNLAPNGAWWASAFQSPRRPAAEQPDFPAACTIHHDAPDHLSWLVGITIPLEFLKKEISFGPHTCSNVTSILNHPLSTFHSAAKLPGADPDFHQPSSFPRITFLRPPSP